MPLWLKTPNCRSPIKRDACRIVDHCTAVDYFHKNIIQGNRQYPTDNLGFTFIYIVYIYIVYILYIYIYIIYYIIYCIYILYYIILYIVYIMFLLHIFWEFLRYALRLHLLFSLFGDKSNTSMDMSGSGRIPPLPNLLVHLLSYNLVAAAGTERWLTWEKQESGAGMIWPSNLAPKIQSSYPLVRSNSSVVERLGEK